MAFTGFPLVLTPDGCHLHLAAFHSTRRCLLLTLSIVLLPTWTHGLTELRSAC